MLKNNILQQAALNNDFTTVKELIEKGADFKFDNEYLLRLAIFQENLNVIKFLIEKGSDINVDAGFPLILSINKNIEIALYLINQGANIYVRNGEVLIISMKKEQYDVITVLLEKGMRLNDIKTDLSTINQNVISFINKWEESDLLSKKLNEELEKKNILLNKVKI